MPGWVQRFNALKQSLWIKSQFRGDRSLKKKNTKVISPSNIEQGAISIDELVRYSNNRYEKGSAYALITKDELKAAAAQAEVELIFKVKKTEHHEKYLVWQLEKPHSKEAGEIGVALS
ncbi:unnamed protein product [Clonostachys chloroleuca]|uniref:Uncharacterized protein n=1 Tax=Clonostachys chloroleuca TaxID=1926264 RepID=A0AA35LYG8_9HYPO|nr:unnamed protein product [Clonostachys chloroleuca]